MTACRWACLLLLACGQASAQTIALISDLNGRYGSTTYDDRVGDAIEAVVERDPVLVISTGDMVAGQSQPRLHADWLDEMWQGFNQVVADPLAEARIPFIVTVGNHDGSGFPTFGLERERFEAQWSGRIPGLEILPGSEWPRRYAARLDGILLLTFDGTRPGKLPPSELRFVEQMLDRYGHTAKATIVFSHLPMWPFTGGREDDILDDASLLNLLHRYGVDVYASGHHHAFYAGTDVAGMVHLAVGALGGNARAFAGEKRRQPHSFSLLDISEKQVRIESRAAPGYKEIVAISGLPATVKGPLGTLRRLDGAADLRH